MTDGGTLKTLTHYLPTLRVSELADVTPVPLEFIDGYQLFVKGELTYLSGAGAAGKTTLMLQLAAAVGLSTLKFGGPAFWLGRPVTTRGPVMFVSAEEDTNALHRKLLEVCADQGIALKDLSNVCIHDLTERDDKVLISCAGRGKSISKTPLFTTFENSVAAIKPVLIIIDNRAQVTMADEIDRNAATVVGNTFRAIAARYGATVILLTHPSLSGMKTGSSGSTGWNNTTRNTVLMCRLEDKAGDNRDDANANANADADDGRRQLTVPKANYGPMGLRANLQWRCGVYVCTDTPVRPDERIGRSDKAKRVFIKLLVASERRGQRVSSNPKSIYAPDQFTKPGMDREGINKREFEAAMNQLLDSGSIEIEMVSPGTAREKRWLKVTSRG